MKIDFEHYEYNGEWYGTEKVEFNEHFFDVDVQIDSCCETMIPESGKNVFLDFLNKLNRYTEKNCRCCISILLYPKTGSRLCRRIQR